MALVEVLRPFMVSGERVDIGSVIELGQHAANMVIAANKARLSISRPEPQPEPQPEPVTARRKSSATHD